MFTRNRDTVVSVPSVSATSQQVHIVTSQTTLSDQITDLTLSKPSILVGNRVVTILNEDSDLPADVSRPLTPIDPAPDTPTITRILVSIEV